MADNIRTLAEQALADAERATPGPWFSTDGCCVFVDGYNLVADAFASAKDHPNGDTILAPWSQPQCAINAQVIAAARTREPQLAAAVLELLKENERLEVVLGGGMVNAEHRASHEWEAYKQTIRERDEARAEIKRRYDAETEAFDAIFYAVPEADNNGIPHTVATKIAVLVAELREARAAEARRIHNWHDALVNEQMLVGVLRQQLAECDALRTARDEACDCLEALDNKFGLSMKVQLQIEAWRAVGKEAK